jgi:hypothetical protein
MTNRTLSAHSPVIHALMREAKFVEYNESPDAPQSNNRDAHRKYPKRRMNVR